MDGQTNNGDFIGPSIERGGEGGQIKSVYDIKLTVTHKLLVILAMQS